MQASRTDPGRGRLCSGLLPLPQPAPEGTLYTCPVHAEVRHPGPGICPLCGRALEPLVDGADVFGRG